MVKNAKLWSKSNLPLSHSPDRTIFPFKKGFKKTFFTRPASYITAAKRSLCSTVAVASDPSLRPRPPVGCILSILSTHPASRDQLAFNQAILGINSNDKILPHGGQPLSCALRALPVDAFGGYGPQTPVLISIVTLRAPVHG